MSAQVAQRSTCRATLAHEHVESAVPGSQEVGQFVALPPAHAGNGQRSQASFHPLTHPVQQYAALLDGHAQRAGEVLSLESLSSTQLGHELVATVQASCGIAYERCQGVGLHALAGLVSAHGTFSVVRARQHRGLGRSLPPAVLRSPVDVVAQDREQPRAELVGFSQPG
ncbi:MAG: hypothetical protein R2705_20705 [Ilumatobacteraceae bacterium]